MKLALQLALAVILSLPAWAAAQGTAFTNRATEIRERAAPDARVVASLPEGAEVKVLARSGGWTRVDAGGQAGWLRVFHLRFPATADASESSGAQGFASGLTSALGFGRKRSQSATIATTGIRGLSPEELKNASPDAEALRRMQSFRADQAAAERFAREGKLSPVDIAYDSGGR